MAKAQKVPVSERALLQRINRRLAEANTKLCKARGPAANTIGEYYILDLDRNTILKTDVDFEALGRDSGALNAWEELVAGE